MRNKIYRKWTPLLLAFFTAIGLVIHLPITSSANPQDNQNFSMYDDGHSLKKEQAVNNLEEPNTLDIFESAFSDISNGERALFANSVADKIKKADVSGLLTNYDPHTVSVINNGEECTLARFPNKYDDGTDRFILDAGHVYSEHEIRITSQVMMRRISRYHTLEGFLLYGYIFTDWNKDMVETDGYTVDEETGFYDFFVPHLEFDSSANGAIAVVNISEELDAPGEYWIDNSTGTFYVYSPSGRYSISYVSESEKPYVGSYGFFDYFVDNSVATIYRYSGSEASVVIPSVVDGYNVACIGISTFKDCSFIKSVTIPGSVKIIENGAFWGCTSLDKVVIPNKVTRIAGAFVGCTSLKNVTLPDSVTDISGAFSGCSKLERLSIPEGVACIGDETFYRCISLISLTIPDNVKSIGEYAFYGCTSLKSATIPDSVTSMGSNSFAGCSALERIYIAINDMSKWCVTPIGNSLPDIPREIYLGGTLVTELVIPDGVETVKAGPFRNCSSLTSVTIPDSVTSISGSAFSGCSSLEKVIIASSSMTDWCGSTIGDNLPDVPKEIYLDGVPVTDLVIPASVEAIKSGPFRNCVNIKTVTIPDSVTTIESDAFNGCSSMSEVYLGSGINAIRDGAFKDCTSLQKVYYNGTENDWLRKVYVGDNNEYLRNAEFIFNYDGPTLTHIPAKAPTFEEEGNIEYWIDLNTGLCYSDDKGKNQIDKDSVIIPKLVDTTVVFEDVKANKWYTESVNFAYNTGLMNGMTETTFEPNSPMSRAMLVTVLWRAEGSPEPASATPFTDLKAKWYKNAVAWAYENGIVNGMTATTFGPDVSISREQIATIIYRYAEFRGDEVSARASITSFPDASKVSKWAKDALSWAVAEGIISGTKSGNTTILDPKGNATRAQVATILMRYLEK